MKKWFKKSNKTENQTEENNDKPDDDKTDLGTRQAYSITGFNTSKDSIRYGR